MEELFKECCICKQKLDPVNFNKNKTKSDGLQSQCRSCNREKSRRYYASNREKHFKATNARKQKIVKNNRQYVYDYIVKIGCVDCGENYPACCDFDHVTGDKTGNISRMIHRGCSLNTIIKEISKCVVRCANCHRKKTALQFNWYSGLVK
jgi:hypothetical protein